MKGLLIHLEVAPTKTHDLAYLHQLLISVSPKLIWPVEELRFLTLAAVAFGYPGEAAEAFAIAARLRALRGKEMCKGSVKRLALQRSKLGRQVKGRTFHLGLFSVSPSLSLNPGLPNRVGPVVLCLVALWSGCYHCPDHQCVRTPLTISPIGRRPGRRLAAVSRSPLGLVR